MEQKQSNESLVRERDFYRSKFEGMEKKIKSLTTDCAYLKKDISFISSFNIYIFVYVCF